MNRRSQTLLLTFLFMTGAARAAGPEAGEVHLFRVPLHSVEHMAMTNAAAELLANKTGRTVEELAVLLESAPAPEVAHQLGLDHDTTRALMDSARATVIERAAGAGLITADQAAQLRAAPRPGTRQLMGDRLR